MNSFCNTVFVIVMQIKVAFVVFHKGGNKEMTERTAENIENSGTKLNFRFSSYFVRRNSLLNFLSQV